MSKANLIVALDRPSLREGLTLLERLPAAIAYVKIGLELFVAEGPDALQSLRQRKKNIFLDLKLHDIPNTVARAVAAAAGLGASMLTLHASGGRAMLQAAAQAARAHGAGAPKLIAVTALTSLAPADLAELGVQRQLSEHVLSLSTMALAAGMDGLVCSVHEAALLRQRLGPKPILITPGIRPAGSDQAAGDQKRIATPTLAVKAGASFLVVGRPILDAPDPRAAAQAILTEMVAAQSA